MLMNVFGEYKIDWNGVRQDEASGHLLCVAKFVAYAYQSFFVGRLGGNCGCAPHGGLHAQWGDL